MDGVFMKKLCRRIFICLMIAFFVWFGTVLADRQKLREELIRIHVVANSDSPADQSIKLSVRDAVLDSMKSELANISDVETARHYLQEKLPHIQSVAAQTLEALGCKDPIQVTLQKETFKRSTNALLSLPAGIYESLRITIGSGEGENWWSVVFPNVILLENTDTGILSVFSESVESNPGADELEIRFWLLDILGRLENYFFPG